MIDSSRKAAILVREEVHNDAYERPQAEFLQAYFDDSGSDQKSPIYTIAGYCGKPGQVLAFKRDWGKALDGPPRFPYWHTNTARELKYHERHKIDKAAVERMELALAEVIVKHSRDIAAVTIEMSKDLYNDIVLPHIDTDKIAKQDPRIATALRSPMFIVFHGAIYIITGIAKQMGAAVEGHHIFMEDAEGAAWQDEICLLSRAYRRMSAPADKKSIGAVTFAPGKGRVTMPALEAADLWASHVRARATYPDAVDPVRILLESVHGARQNRRVVTRGGLELFVRAVKKDFRYAPEGLFR